MTAVRLAACARQAWPFLPSSAEPGTWWQGPLGELVRVEPDGTATLAPNPLPHWRGPAGDPCAGTRRAAP